MKYFIPILFGTIILWSNCTPTPNMNDWNDTPKSDFLTSQLQFSRVRDAFQKKEISIKKLLLKTQINSFQFDLYLRAFKQEEVLEVWVKPKTTNQYQLLKAYDFCRNSGTLGPKRKEGDYQIPEGFYRISHYNPKSNFLLSLKVNYPNAADKTWSDPTKPGGEIYIHGSCQTVGCIPITNDKIQEVYLLSVLAKEEGTSIPIHIFPFKMSTEKLVQNVKDFSNQLAFWESLKEGFDSFEKDRKIPTIRIDQKGNYLINE